MKFPNRAVLESLRKAYPAGTVVELIHMEDAQAPPAGTLGKVEWVDDVGNINVRWQTGSSLSLIPGVDTFRIRKEAGA